MGVDHFQKKMRKRVAWERVGGGGGEETGTQENFRLQRRLRNRPKNGVLCPRPDG